MTTVDKSPGSQCLSTFMYGLAGDQNELKEKIPDSVIFLNAKRRLFMARATSYLSLVITSSMGSLTCSSSLLSPAVRTGSLR